MAGRNQDWKREDEDDGEQDMIDDSNYKAQKDAIILAIDVRDSMSTPPPAAASNAKKADKDSPLEAALKCAYRLMEQRIISNPKDMMGILLFGTKKTKSSIDSNGRGGLGYPNCYLLVDLDIPSADDVRALKALVEDGEDEDGVLIPSVESTSMSNVLFCANQIFTTRAANFGSRRLFIITNNDDPHSGDKAATSAAAVRAKDLYDLEVTIDLFPINLGDSKFNLSKFYDDIIYRDPLADANTPAIPVSTSGQSLSLLNSLTSNILSKQAPKRSLFSNVPFEIAPGLRISVKGYNVLHRQTPARTCYIWTGGDKPQLVSGETLRIAEDTTRTVEKQEIRKAYKFGDEYVYFSTEEQKSLRDFGAPIIRIIGFKPRSLLPVWASIKKSTFIFPSEEDYVGSSRVFAALWTKLCMDDKVGIAWCILRANSQPILAAVVPSKERSDEDSATPYLPSGLWIWPLPFADDMREIRAPGELIRSSDELKSKARTIIQQLQLPKGIYNPSKYPNPSLQWHYKILKALALEEEVPDKAEDATEPKYKAILKRAGGYLQEWYGQLEQEAGRAVAARGLKREATDSIPQRSQKQARTASSMPVGTSLTLAQLKAAVESGGITKMTVAQLRDLAGSKGLNTGGKKMELVERIEQWMEEAA